MIRLATMLAALGVVAQEPQAAPAAPPVRDRLRATGAFLSDLPGLSVTGYEVSGGSPNAIRRSMNSRRPAAGSDGERHDAVTSWSYRTRWMTGADGQCLPSSAEVTLTVSVILPDLTTREQLSSRDQADWDRYFAALVGHEQNHGRIAVAGRDQMQAGMRASPSCESMQALVRQTTAETSAASRDYDRLTKHGKRESALYPSRTR